MNPRLTELLDHYLDGVLSPEGVVELEASLAASDEARAEFWKRTRLHSALRIVAQEQRGEKLARESQLRVVAKPVRAAVRSGARRTSVHQLEQSRRSWWIPLTTAAAVAVAAIVSWKNFPLRKAKRAVSIAVLARAADAVWADAAFAPQPGRVLQAGWLRLKAGAVQIEFSRGARVVIAGPAEFQLVSENEGRLNFGKVWARVPSAAHGFTVRGRDFKAVDLGTEFGCSVPADDPAEVHVFDGAVDVNTRQVRENHALQLANPAREIPAQRSAFIGEEQMPQRTAFLRESRTEQDIGVPGRRGSTSLDSRSGVWTVMGGGADIYGVSDQFHFVSQEFAGDGTLVARVSSSQVTDGYAKSGVMWRESNAADARYAFVFVGPNTLGYEVRTAAARASSGASYGSGSAPKWLKLVRAGNVFTAFASDDGVAWKQLGTLQTMPMSATARAGLAVTAHNDAALNLSTFENVSAQP